MAKTINYILHFQLFEMFHTSEGFWQIRPRGVQLFILCLIKRVKFKKCYLTSLYLIVGFKIVFYVQSLTAQIKFDKKKGGVFFICQNTFQRQN